MAISPPALRAQLQDTLQTLATRDLQASTTQLLATPGYASPKTQALPNDPRALVKEIENPQLASARELHQAKGYPQAWIERRLRSISVRGAGNNLRDHMTDLELICTMLGEASTSEIARRADAQGFIENRTSAKQGGAIAGNARKALEAKTGKTVLSKTKYLPPPTTTATPDLLGKPDTATVQSIKIRRK
jgi:hypothetical protein